MTTEPMTQDERSWRLFEAAGLAGVGIALFAILAISATLIPPVLLIAVIYLALAGAVWRWIERPRVALAAAVLGLLGLLGNTPNIAADLSHINSWGSFAPNAVAVVVELAGIAAGFISFFAPSMQGRQLLMGAAGTLAIVLVVASVGASVAASSDEAQSGDVMVLAEGAEYLETLTASAGLTGFHVSNEDRIRHTFVIEGTSVAIEVPVTKARRVEVVLEPGEYPFVCDIPGHERMEGVLTVQ